MEIRAGQFEQGGRRLLCLVRDITERKRAEDELRASEARFRSFVDHATDGFFLFDEHQTLLDVNRQACESLGYSREEMIGMHPRDFDAGLDPASIARIGEQIRPGKPSPSRRVTGARMGLYFRSRFALAGSSTEDIHSVCRWRATSPNARRQNYHDVSGKKNFVKF